MAEFVFLYRGGEPATSPEQQQEITQQWMAWLKSLGESGHVIDAGRRLARSGKIVRASGMMITDGPFAETKEVIGGFTLIKAADVTQAAALAQGCPILARGGAVEVRAVD
jgi:hypothetical protein